MKVLVTGANGQLGYDVLKALQARGVESLGADIQNFDITDPDATSMFMLSYGPDAVIHCAAYTAVDKAEDEPERCYAINVTGTKNIADACRKTGAKLMYVSTDYVFPGMGDVPYEVDSPTGPLSVYGKTKLEGEQVVQSLVEKHFIVRISWAFGKNGNNFVKTMLKLGKERKELNVVSDQIGSPTYTADLAPLLCDMIVTDKYSVYHATNEGYCSWAEFAKEIFSLSGYDVQVNTISTEQYHTKAKRPFNSRLSKASLDAAEFSRLPGWKDALERYLRDWPLCDVEAKHWCSK